MKAGYRIMRQILTDIAPTIDQYIDEEPDIRHSQIVSVVCKLRDYVAAGLTTEAAIDDCWNMAHNIDDEQMRDAIECFRKSGEDSGLPDRNYSRHYECKEVATTLGDGTCVGWTYWFGGGKYGEPSQMEWMSKAYDVEFKEVTKVVREWRVAK